MSGAGHQWVLWLLVNLDLFSLVIVGVFGRGVVKGN